MFYAKVGHICAPTCKRFVVFNIFLHVIGTSWYITSIYDKMEIW